MTMTQCEMCEEMGNHDCKYCSLGNPCLGCKDYDAENDKCKSDGGCADTERSNKHHVGTI